MKSMTSRFRLVTSVSNRDLVKVIPPVLLVIMGASGSLFLKCREFVMSELTILLSWILFGFLWVYIYL